MKNITVLITGAGAPGAPGVIKSIREIKDRVIRLIGVDSDETNSVGKVLLDKFIIGPHSSDVLFTDKMLEICIQEKVDVVLPLVTNELFLFSKDKQRFKVASVEVSVSDYSQLLIANDKAALMKYCKDSGIPCPDFYFVNNRSDFDESLTNLDFPKKRVCFKPPISNGMRGFRVLHSDTNITENSRLNALINEKPNDVSITYNHFMSIINESSYFPELLVMEYLPGEELSVDVLASNGRMHSAVPRTRDKIKMGISFAGTTVFDEEIIKYSAMIVEGLRLNGNIGLQFKRDSKGVPKIIESNPRIQGTIVLCTAAGNNMINNAIRNALGEELIDYETIWNTRMIRYWDEVFVHPEGVS